MYSDLPIVFRYSDVYVYIKHTYLRFRGNADPHFVQAGAFVLGRSVYQITICLEHILLCISN